MNMKDTIILGANHQFLFPNAIDNGNIHTQTLAEMSAYDEIDALDCWVWRGKSRTAAETAILRSCGKVVNYNVGDRSGEDTMFFASPDAGVRVRSRQKLWRELDAAMESGAKKIIIGSGPDVPGDRVAAVARFKDLMFTVKERLPNDVTLCLEPTDYDVDKYFLFGSVGDTTRFIESCREDGFVNFGMLLDMGHIPLMHSTIEEAAHTAAAVLTHIHLGNCIIKNPQNPMFGDKHVPWGIPDGEYGEQDVCRMIRALLDNNYLRVGGKQTVSFEMRPIEGLPYRKSLGEMLRVFRSAWDAEQAK